MKTISTWVMAAILTCGFATTMTSCNNSDDEFWERDAEVRNDMKATKAEVGYIVDLGANTLELADVEVIYLDETGSKKSFTMTENHWEQKRILNENQFGTNFSLQVIFHQKVDAIIDDAKTYEFGCTSRIPFTCYNSKGNKICDHPGTVTEYNGAHPQITGDKVPSWWLTYEVGINPDKLFNFEKKTLTIKKDVAVFNDMDYDYPYPTE